MLLLQLLWSCIMYDIKNTRTDYSFLVIRNMKGKIKNEFYKTYYKNTTSKRAFSFSMNVILLLPWQVPTESTHLIILKCLNWNGHLNLFFLLKVKGFGYSFSSCPAGRCCTPLVKQKKNYIDDIFLSDSPEVI